jgi:hypothetical protein
MLDDEITLLKQRIEELEKKVEMAELYIMCQRDLYLEWNQKIGSYIFSYYNDELRTKLYKNVYKNMEKNDRKSERFT